MCLTLPFNCKSGTKILTDGDTCRRGLVPLPRAQALQPRGPLKLVNGRLEALQSDHRPGGDVEGGGAEISFVLKGYDALRILGEHRAVGWRRQSLIIDKLVTWR